MARETVEKRRERLLGLIDNPNVRTMLDLIAASEGVAHGYNTGFGNTVLDALEDHPRELKPFTETSGRRNLTSAAGRYQFLAGTWDDVAPRIGASDFMPENQDLGAVYLMQRRGALDAVLEGDFNTAISKLGREWAGLPSSPYAQPKRSQEFVDNFLTSRNAERTAPEPAPEPTGAPDVASTPLGGIAELLRNPANIEEELAARVRDLFAQRTSESEQQAREQVQTEPEPEVPPAIEAITQMQSDARALPEPEDGPTWEDELLASAVDAEADNLRQNAVGRFFGDPNITRVRLPKALEDAINRAIRSI